MGLFLLLLKEQNICKISQFCRSIDIDSLNPHKQKIFEILYFQELNGVLMLPERGQGQSSST